MKKYLLLFILLLFFPSICLAGFGYILPDVGLPVTSETGIAFDNASSVASTWTSSTLTVEHTVSGSDRILLVGISTRGAQNISGVTYNSDAMTNITHITPGNLDTSVWYLINPDTGTHDIVASIAIQTIVSMIGVSYTGVHQTTALGTEGTGTAAAETVSAGTVTSDTDELVISFVGVRSGADLTPGSSQTSRGSVKGSTSISAGVSEKTGATSVSTSYSWTGAVSASIISVPLKPVN